MYSKTIGRPVRRVSGMIQRLHSAIQATLSGVRGEVTRRDLEVIEGYLVVPADTAMVDVGLYINDFQAMTSVANLNVGPYGRREKRHFRFALYDFWRFAHRGDKITVRVGRQVIPLENGQWFFHPRRNGKEDTNSLRERFERGEIFGQGGKIQLSRVADTQWQHHVIRLYHEVSGLLERDFGYQAFLFNGTLLGAVRENGFIGHDRDFDSAYISRQTDPRSAAAELYEISLALIERGYSVVPKSSCIAILDKDSGTAQIDLFHLYATEQGVLQFPFGSVEAAALPLAVLGGLAKRDFVGHTVLAPVNSRELVAHIYGPNWQFPDPSFHWPTARQSRAAAGLLEPDQQDRLYWANFYARVHDFEPSSFARHLLERSGLPRLVIDLGCGEGRDAVAFAAAGHRVLGLDRAPSALRQARRREGHGVHFEQCELTDADALARQIEAMRAAHPDAPVVFYGRALLPSLSQEGQQQLLKVLEEQARPGDLLALELRTDKDHGRPKAHFRAYRRFQAAGQLLRELEGSHGWTVLEHVESAGLARYRDEDPIVLRLVAERPAAQPA